MTDLKKQAYDTVVECGGSKRAAALKLGIARQTVQNRYNAYLAARPEVESAPAPEPLTAAEIQDATFWRNKARRLEKDLLDATHLAEQLVGIRRQPVHIPPFAAHSESAKHQAVPFGHLTDVHMGEVIEAGEINGCNEFNPQIARERIRRFFTAFATLGRRWGSDCEVVGSMLALGGDMVSGDIHAELRETNALTAHEQVFAVVEEVCSGIEHLLKTFGIVHVPAVPGNHGRVGVPKTPFKGIGRASYDTLIASMVADKFKGDNRVTFQIASGHDVLIPIFGRNVLLTHGHAIGTGGGMGFAGPSLPIVRGGKKILAQYGSMGEKADLVLIGHYHHSTAPSGILAGGSIPGYSEFGHGIRSGVEPPKQWVGLFHSRWFLRERVEVILDDVNNFSKPTVRVPAWTA